MAGGPVVAGRVLAPADGGTAVPARVPGGAGAGVLVHAVPAGAPVGTRGGGTVVHVVVAVPPREAGLAAADVSVAEVHALRTIGTRRGTAGIHLLLTVKARKAPRTAAGVPALGVVGAPAPIEAGAVGTHHGTQLAHPAVEAGWAGAGVAVLKVRAAPAVPARPAAALVHLRLAAGPRVPRPAGARVAPLARVGAGGAVPAGLVVRAVVEVLVAEKAPPALLAVALPGLLAGAVETAWVPDALVAVPALPAHSALAFPWLVTKSVLLIAPWQTDGLCAVLALPARVADFLPSLPAGEVAKGVISGAAEDGAAFAKVVLITHKAVGVLEVRAAAAVQILGPLLPNRQVPLCGQAADKSFWVLCCKVIRRICVESFNDQREGSRPGEAKGEADGVAEGGVRARAVREAEGVDAQHRSDGAAVGAGRLGGHAGLVVLEAHAEEGPAGARRRARAPAAAVAVPQQPLLVDELLQLQLEHPGAPDLAQQGREYGEGQGAPPAHGAPPAALALLASPRLVFRSRQGTLEEEGVPGSSGRKAPPLCLGPR